VTIAIGLHQPMVKTRTPQTIHQQAAVFTPDGTRVGAPLRQTLRFTLVPGGGDVLRYDLLTQLPAKPGRYEVRIAVHRATDNVSGSVYADVTVPDFAKAPVSLSGVWLGANPSPTGVPRDALASLLPVVPTASREFAPRDEVTAFFRIYQGGGKSLTAVPLAVRILDDKDETVASSTGTIPAEQFAASTRAADHRFALPRGLAPGRYLLTFEATLGETTARRDVVFTVR
jgi:hypothetical protein